MRVPAVRQFLKKIRKNGTAVGAAQIGLGDTGN